MGDLRTFARADAGRSSGWPAAGGDAASATKEAGPAFGRALPTAARAFGLGEPQPAPHAAESFQLGAPRLPAHAVEQVTARAVQFACGGHCATELGPPAAVQAQLKGGTSLPPAIADRFSQAYGHDLSSARVHPESELAQRAGARAFTVGRDVAFAPGEYRPGTTGGDQLIGHELAHVVQQAGGTGTVQAAGLCGGGCEKEADAAAATALAGGRVSGLSPVSPGTVQRQDPPKGAPAGPSSSGIQVQQMTIAEFEAATGMSADALPEGQYVPGDQLQKKKDEAPLWPIALGTAAARAPMPGLPVPPGSTGLLVTPGHVSDLAAAGDQMAVRGFRSNFFQHLLSHAERNSPFYQKLFGIGPGQGPQTIALNRGVPGTYANDWFYPYLPGAKAVTGPSADAAGAVDFLQNAPEIPLDPITGKPIETYRFPAPPATDPYYEPSFGDLPGFGEPGFCPPGVVNCATVPRDVHERMLGGAPEMVGPDGTPIDPLEGGSMRTMRSWASDEAARAAQGLKVTPTTGAMWARAGVGVVKAGGVVLMVYGAVKTYDRIAGASSSQMGTVVGEEAGSWAGGFIGNVLASALGGAFVCAETGPGAFFCAVGFGLVGGATGSVVGGGVGHDIGNAIDTLRNAKPGDVTETILQVVGTPEDKRQYYDFKNNGSTPVF